jgi:hypothetical protein
VSTLFSDVWRPLLLALSTAVVLALCEQLVPYSIFRVMECRGVFPYRSSGVAGTARQCGGVDGHALRRRDQPCAPGFLTDGSGTTAAPLPPSRSDVSSARTRCRRRTFRFRLI